MILIVGGGLAGLSTAHHLQGLPCRIMEKEPEAGGLCRSYQKAGFTFDYTGHLLHFRQAAIKALVERLLPTQLEKHTRRSYVYSHQTYTEYPFQVNTYGLPQEVVRDCLLGFIDTLTQREAGQSNQGCSFKDWILDSLGEGIAKHFMIPFNEKLWQIPLEELTADWVSWLVPKPELRDVINGALGIKDKAFGYNPSFLYPAKGGIQALPQAFLPSVRDIAYEHELLEVDTTRRRAVFRAGRNGQRTQDYEVLVSTIPLPDLVQRCTDLPLFIREAATALRWVSVYSVNLGIARERISDKHWIYFPERNYPFYRAGFPMNFSPELGRPGCSSLYVEISHLPDENIPPDQLIERVRIGLEQAGILRRDDEIAVADVKNIYYAYVLFDRHRARVVPQILAELKRRGIYSIGRYGLWEHTSMEDAIAQGKGLADMLRTRQAAA
jgi:protoporphyrinogen oxidase